MKAIVTVRRINAIVRAVKRVSGFRTNPEHGFGKLNKIFVRDNGHVFARALGITKLEKEAKREIFIGIKRRRDRIQWDVVFGNVDLPDVEMINFFSKRNRCKFRVVRNY